MSMRSLVNPYMSTNPTFHSGLLEFQSWRSLSFPRTEAAFEIGDYYNANRSEPTGVEMIEITEKAARHFPDTFSKEKRGEMLRMSIELAKNIISRTRIIPLVGDEPEEQGLHSWKDL